MVWVGYKAWQPRLWINKSLCHDLLLNVMITVVIMTWYTDTEFSKVRQGWQWQVAPWPRETLLSIITLFHWFSMWVPTLVVSEPSGPTHSSLKALFLLFKGQWPAGIWACMWARVVTTINIRRRGQRVSPCGLILWHAASLSEWSHYFFRIGHQAWLVESRIVLLTTNLLGTI